MTCEEEKFNFFWGIFRYLNFSLEWVSSRVGTGIRKTLRDRYEGKTTVRLKTVRMVSDSLMSSFLLKVNQISFKLSGSENQIKTSFQSVFLWKPQQFSPHIQTRVSLSKYRRVFTFHSYFTVWPGANGIISPTNVSPLLRNVAQYQIRPFVTLLCIKCFFCFGLIFWFEIPFIFVIIRIAIGHTNQRVFAILLASSDCAIGSVWYKLIKNWWGKIIHQSRIFKPCLFVRRPHARSFFWSFFFDARRGSFHVDWGKTRKRMMRGEWKNSFSEMYKLWGKF